MNVEDGWFEEYRNDPEYQFELTMIAVGEGIVAALLQLGITRSELAKRLHVSRPRISQILAGDENLTLRTLVGVAVALESKLWVHFDPVGSIVKTKSASTESWIETNLGESANEAGNRQLALAA